jgi:hypothetical protein
MTFGEFKARFSAVLDVAGSFYRLPIVGDHRDPFDRMLVSGKPSTQTSSSRQETGRWQPLSLMGWS